MNDLRIRTEAMADALWPQSFLPPQARPEAVFGDDDSDFGPVIAALARALTALFGLETDVSPGPPPIVADGETWPRVAPALAGLLATLRLGGDAAREGAVPAAFGGVALTRHARAIADTIDTVAARQWPVGCTLPGLDIKVRCGVVAGHAHVPAPPRRPRAAAVPVAALAVRLFDMPLRVRVELSSDTALIASLLPLRAGTVLPISPAPEMPLIIGDHRIGRACVAALPDGRQQATIVAMGVAPIAGART